MHINKNKLAVYLLLSIFLVDTACAQTINKKNGKPKRNYALVLYAGGGFAGYTANINTQPIGLQTDIKRTSLCGTVRIMWHPNYRLRLGLESGYTNFYSYSLKNGNSSGKVNLRAIPILIVWSIKIVNRVNLFAGFGSYFLTTHLDYNGRVKSSTLSLGSNVALNYVQPISKKCGVAIEGKWLNAFQTKDNMVSLQLQLVWKFLEY